MLAITTLLLVVTLSMILVRVATIALSYTGLSEDVARFQAMSALSGVGFTTRESDTVVNHPVRRKVVMYLMLAGNAGIVTAMSSLVLTFVTPQSVGSAAIRLGVLVAGLAVLWIVASSRWVNARLSRAIAWALKRYTRLDVKDYSQLLHLAGDFRVVEVRVACTPWLADKTLAELPMRAHKVQVLGIRHKDGGFIGAPDGQARVLPEDILILYGPQGAFEGSLLSPPDGFTATCAPF